MVKEHKEYITKERQKELMEELEQLKTVERKKIAEQLEYARSLGDLSENAEYHDAREKQGELEAKIEYIESILNTAEIIRNKKSDTVIIGSKVTLQKEGSKTIVEYELVSSNQADMRTNKLSHESPIGEAILGKKVDDTITIKTPNGQITYTIKKLE